MKYNNVAILFLAIITIIFCCSNYKERKVQPCTELFANPPDGKDTCLYLTVDLNLPAGDSMLMSEKFLQKISKTNPNFVIEDSTIRFENNTYRRAETFLPFNKIIHYYAQYDSVIFKLYLKRINLTDIEFLLIAEREGNVLQYARDTVVYEPYGGNEMTNKYGFRFWGYPYCTSGSKIYTQLLLTKEVKMYAAVIQNNTFDSGRDIFNRVIFLTRTDIAQPYNYFLNKSMERLIDENENIMRQTDDDEMNHYKEDFGKFKLLVNDISLSCSDSTIYEDTTLMDRALFCSMDSVVDLLRQNGFAERKVKSQLENHLFTEYEFNHFSGTLFINWAGEVRSRDFERISFTNELYERPENPGYYIPGYVEFNNTFYCDATSMRIHFKDKIIALLADNGFENISFIITVWEKSGEDYLLKGILDKYLSSSIGFVNIDTIFAIDDQRNFMIGTTSGGDAGDEWGSVWIGVWELPASLKIVFQKYWAEIYDQEHTTLNYRFVKSDEIEVVEKEYGNIKYGHEDYLSDSIVKISLIDLDTLVAKEHIRR